IESAKITSNALMRRSSILAALYVVSLAPTTAAGKLRVDLIETKNIKLDGVPKEWTGLQLLSTAVKGSPKKPDLEARAALGYDANNLYVAADVTDDVLKPGGDKVEVALGFPGGTLADIELFPGDPGKSPGTAKIS